MSQNRDPIQSQNTEQIEQPQLREQAAINDAIGKSNANQSSDCQFQQSQTSGQSSSSEQQAEQGFEIIGKDTDNHVLLTKLKPDHVMWFKGNILFSSKQTKQRLQFDDFFKRIVEGFGYGGPQVKMLVNQGNQMCYHVLSREEPNNGKILLLSQNVYRQTFYINMKYLLTINYQSSQYKLVAHPDIKYLKLVKPQKVTQPLFVSLQSSKNTAIIEKYLARQQVLYLPNSCILAMSQGIKCKWDGKVKGYKFMGEGYVFFQPKSQINKLAIKNREMILANIFIILMIITLYIVEYLFLK